MQAPSNAVFVFVTQNAETKMISNGKEISYHYKNFALCKKMLKVTIKGYVVQLRQGHVSIKKNNKNNER